MESSSTENNAKRGRFKGRKVTFERIQYCGPSYIDLPKDILVSILLRLSVMSIFICKSVCKKMFDLISDPEFAQLHYNQAEICPLIRSFGATFRSRLLYLVQPDQGEFERKLDMCDHDYPKSKCFCDVKVKLDTKLKLPLRNLKKILTDKDGEGSMVNPRGAKLKIKDHKYGVVNSCNGLLCLSNPTTDKAVVVCNPVTGEFVNLPESDVLNCPILVFSGTACGFGYSPTTNQYKVIRMFRYLMILGPHNNRLMKVVTEVNVLGTDSWKEIGHHPEIEKEFPTYLRGRIHWLTHCSVVIFDVEKECFTELSLPTLRKPNQHAIKSMGVLGGELCITKQYAADICVWVTKDYPNNGANWCKVFSANLFNGAGTWPRGVYQPLKYMNNGGILMFHAPSNAFIYKDPRKLGYKYLKIRGVEAKLETIPHVPTFISLKDVLSGNEVEVLNVKTRCAELNLHKETKAISLVEEEYQDR